MPTHEHKTIRLKDPVTGHLWEICFCGFSIDIDELRGGCA